MKTGVVANLHPLTLVEVQNNHSWLPSEHLTVDTALSEVSMPPPRSPSARCTKLQALKQSSRASQRYV